MMLPCGVVRDLLPSYMERLTGEETAALVREHLDACADCRAAHDAMAAELAAKKPPKPGRDFFKKLKRKQLIGAALSVVVTLLCMAGLYNMEYCVDATDTASLEAAANESLSFSGFDADFTESVRAGRLLFVQFRSREAGAEQKQALLQLERGLFGKYRVRAALRSDWALYFSIVEQIGRKNYLIISGVNDPVGAETFRLYKNDRRPAYEGEPSENDTGAPFYEGETAPQLLLVQEIAKTDADALRWPFSIRYYDANGGELDSRTLAESYGFDGSMSLGGGSGHAPVTLYVYLGILLVLGIVFVRYFLT